MDTKYVVTGMTCGHCVNHVTEEVEAVEGVDSVNVQLEGGEMTISSAEPIEFDAIVEAVMEAGDYTVTQA